MQGVSAIDAHILVQKDKRGISEGPGDDLAWGYVRNGKYLTFYRRLEN